MVRQHYLPSHPQRIDECLHHTSTVTSPDLQKEKNVTKAAAQSITELPPLSQITFIFLRIVGVIGILGREVLPPCLSPLLPLSESVLTRAFDQFLGPQDRELFGAASLQKDRS